MPQETIDFGQKGVNDSDARMQGWRYISCVFITQCVRKLIYDFKR